MPDSVPDPCDQQLNAVPGEPPVPACRTRRTRASSAASDERLASEMIERLARLDDVTLVDGRTGALGWPEGSGGPGRSRPPRARVERTGGDVAFVDAVPLAKLELDVSLGGTRSRVELECAARGASYEIWTEAEIREDLTVVDLVRVAVTAERAAFARALRGCGSPAGPPPPIVSALATRLRIDRLMALGNKWIGRTRLTGIPTVLLGGLTPDPDRRLLVWRPHDVHWPGPRYHTAGRTDNETGQRPAPAPF